MYPILSSPVEEYCLALLLQHPELKAHCQALSPEYFENSENHEIFVNWQRVNDLPSLRDGLDPAIWEHLDSLVNRNLPSTQIEQKYADCALRLRKEFLRNLEARREEVLALEVELGGAGADLAKLEEQGIEVSVQLGEAEIERDSLLKKAGRERWQRR